MQKLIDEMLISLEIEKSKEEAIEALRYKISAYTDEVLNYLFEETVLASTSETPTIKVVRVFEDFKTTNIEE